jgi:hypothetical protein
MSKSSPFGRLMPLLTWQRSGLAKTWDWWNGMHGSGHMAIQLYMRGIPTFKRASGIQFKGWYLIPQDWSSDYTPNEIIMLNTNILSARSHGLEIRYVTFTELQDILLQDDIETWQRNYRLKKNASHYGRTESQYLSELLDLWKMRWPLVPYPYPD